MERVHYTTATKIATGLVSPRENSRVSQMQQGCSLHGVRNGMDVLSNRCDVE